ncbi:MAG: D-Ala-D-Ala carboxypeptidase family metallohydrolase [Myxococcota bacterium]
MGRFLLGCSVVLLAIGTTGCDGERCGNGQIETNEICDDGNAEGGDGCSATCEVEACYPGENGNGRTCFTLTEADRIGDSAYDYPSPLDNSVQYSAPARYLDLDRINLGRLIASNFAIGEIAQPAKGRYAVVQAHAIERLQDLRDELGALRVNSGYRSPGYNDSIPGSATYSRHQFGDAFDLDPLETDLDALEAACNANGASYVGVYVTHRHCDWREATLDEAFYGTEFEGTNSDVPLDIASVRTLRPATDAWIEPVDGARGLELAAPAVGWDEGEPLREWTAYDARGYIIDEQTSTTYVPPVHAVEVEVEVGRDVVRSFPL